MISIYGGGLAGGRYSIVALSRGSKDGLGVGDTLALLTAGYKIEDRYRDVKTAIELPEERNGLLYVFRVFDRVSYALVMVALRPVEIGDAVRNP